MHIRMGVQKNRIECKGTFTKGGRIVKNNLEALRKERGLSQEQFGKLMGVSRQTIISLEKGKYNPSLELAFKISEFFSNKIEDIFVYKGGQ
jgi:putative transcriptional regulator